MFSSIFTYDNYEFMGNNKYNGKEYDNMHGLNSYDYGARQYNPVTLRWDRMDPLAEKYYSTSPYVYCGNNPVRFIDLDGRDDYDVNEDGSIILRKRTESSTDMLISANNSSLEIGKAFMKSHSKMSVSVQGSKAVGDNKVFQANIDMYNSSDIDEATHIYEFLKSNTNVEWSKTVVGDSEGTSAFVSTSHDEQIEAGLGVISSVITEGSTNERFSNISKYDRIYDASHTHSLGNLTVSPGDVKIAKMIQTKYPQANLSIFDGNTYYSFDKNSEAGMLPNLEVTGRRR